MPTFVNFMSQINLKYIPITIGILEKTDKFGEITKAKIPNCDKKNLPENEIPQRMLTNLSIESEDYRKYKDKFIETSSAYSCYLKYCDNWFCIDVDKPAINHIDEFGHFTDC